MTDIFPAFSLGAVALLNLMARLDPPPLVRGGVVSVLMSVLALYLFGQLHLYLADWIGLPAYVALTIVSAGVIWWNYRQGRIRRT